MQCYTLLGLLRCNYSGAHSAILLLGVGCLGCNYNGAHCAILDWDTWDAVIMMCTVCCTLLGLWGCNNGMHSAMF